MKRFAVAIATVALATSVVGLSGCSSYASVQQALADATPKAAVSDGSLLAAGTLTVGVNSSNAPYAWQADSSSDVICGTDVDVAVALADEMGLSLRFVNVGTDGAAAAGSLCDVVMGVSPSQVAGTSVNVVGNYAETAPAVFARSASGDVTLDALAAGTVGVQTDSASAKTLATKLPTLNPQGFSTLNDAFEALESGTVQYVVCDSYLGGYLAADYDDISFAGALEVPVSRGVAVNAANASLQSAVQDAFDDIASDGILDMVRTSWVGSLPSAITDRQVSGSAPAAESAATDAAAEGEAAEATSGEGATEDAAEAPTEA